MSIKLGKINIGRNTKTYTRDMSFDVNTTSDFGFCQPNLMLMVNPKSNVSIKARSLVRLAPMPAPSFARMSLISKYNFVPYADVCEYYEAMLEGIPQGSRMKPTVPTQDGAIRPSLIADVPLYLPFCSPFWLFANLILRSDSFISIYTGTAISSSKLVEIAPYDVLEDHSLSTKALLAASVFYNCGRFPARYQYYNGTAKTIEPIPVLDYGDFVKIADYDTFTTAIGDSLNPSSADFVFEVNPQNYISAWGANFTDTFKSIFADALTGYSDPILTKTPFTVCVRLSSKGRRLFKILKGLGYNLDLTDGITNLNLLPLFAYYKAWFDNYSPNTNNSPWTTTACYQLIKKFDGINFVSDIDIMNSSDPDFYQLWCEFFYNELPNTYYTNQCDFISAHTAELNTAPYGLFQDSPMYDYSTNYPRPGNGFYGYNTFDEDSPETKQLDPSEIVTSHAYTEDDKWYAKQNYPGLPLTTSRPLSIIQLRLLNTLSKWVNKDSVIGTKLADYMRVHFGADVANNLLQNAYNLGTSVTPINVNDIYSNSDTISDNGGDYLGAYAGKGIGFGNTDIQFKSDKHGIIIGMMSIVPENNFYQGYDTSLLAVDPYTIPRPEFDALGYELTGKSAFVENTYFSAPATGVAPNDNSSFGFIPRFSGFKFKHNVVNGDFRRSSTKDSLSAYFLDKEILSNNPVYSVTSTNGTYDITHYGDYATVPQASPEWRFVGKYPWLGNLNRIFYNDSSINAKRGYTDDLLDDNFIIQQAYDVKVTDFLKPLSMSYDTFDEEVDNSSMSVHKD